MTPKPTRQSTPVSFHRVSGAALLAGVFAVAASPASALEPSELRQLYQAQGDVRAVGGAMFGWSFDQVDGLPPAPPATVDVTTVPVISRTALEAILVPDYIDEIPDVDPWGNPYEYRFDPSWNGAGSFGGARSAGSDGVFEGTVYDLGETLEASDDLLRWDGDFVRQLGAPFRSLTEAHLRVLQQITIFEETIIGWLWIQWLPQALAPAPAPLPGTVVDLSLYEQISAAELRAVLAPFVFVSGVPDLDPWGHPWDYYFDPDPPFEVPLVAIRTRGRDGVAEGDVYTMGTFPALDFGRDVVVADLVEFQYPAGWEELIFVDDFERGDARFWSEWSP
jgi:hypothetical protein